MGVLHQRNSLAMTPKDSLQVGCFLQVGYDAIQPLETSASKSLICNDRICGASGLQNFDAMGAGRRRAWRERKVAQIGPRSHARAGEANKTADFQIPASGDRTVQIVDTKPARLQAKRVALDTTDRVYGVINRFRDQPGTRFKGVRIEIGEGENTVTVRFQEREVTAAMIEGVVNSLRQVLHEDQAPVAITIADGIQFDTGFEAKEFAKTVGIELRPGDIVQEQ